MDNSSFCFDRLPKHLFELIILTRLSLRDLIRFGATCHSMRSLAAEIQNYYHQLPWLMISQDKDTQTGTFFSLSESKIYHLKLEDVPSQSYCCGSTQGYLIMANRDENFLYNPFSHDQVSLPQQYVPRQDTISASNDFRYYFMKAILSSPPKAGTSQCVVAALCSNSHVVELCKPHDAEWSVFSADKDVDNQIIIIYDPGDEEEEVVALGEKETGKEIVVMDELETEDKLLFSDVLFHKELLYGLTFRNQLVRFEIQNTKPTYRILNVLPMEMPLDTTVQYINNYLVESCGALLMVYRFRKCRGRRKYGRVHITINFLVFKLDESSDVPQWVELKSIGDQMIFLGRNSSISISAKGVPGFKGNCIYFTEDSRSYYFGESHKRPYCSDNGIFYLEDGHIASLFTPDDTHTFNIQPIWVTPYKINAMQL
ncbi:hypothetical protein AQUCO_00201108v1 [Aquilegia coerulea]|uniref:KIB1-4 beta-propeller domain-containing protein n=1 Tax=Aquilegia coerulea TaxID=218851 RepID=A0A2G5F6L6_AQUCA|nr:hypothetical protein AQUCO_00201108v1 [Aquilegia coerulea]